MTRIKVVRIKDKALSFGDLDFELKFEIDLGTVS